MSKFSMLAFILLCSTTLPTFGSTGVLVIAHGTMCQGHDHGHDHDDHEGSDCEPSDWEKAVLDAVEAIRPRHAEPIEVAFGMWNTTSFNAGIARLEKHFAPETALTKLVVVPLFISSHSMVTQMQQYIFRQRQDRPFPIQAGPVSFGGEILFLSSIDYDPVVSKILSKRADDLITASNAEASATELVIVMHGPVEEAHNHLWLANAQLYAAELTRHGFADIHTLSLRDDADAPVRDRATEILRETVKGITLRDRHALILPLVIAGGGIEGGILERLSGLDYVWNGQTLLPDILIGDYLSKKITDAL